MISLGGVVALKALRIGGRDLDRAIASQVRQKLDLVVSEQLAEDLKWKIASVDPGRAEVIAELHGRQTQTGIPDTGQVSSTLVSAAISDLAAQMVQGAASCLADAPPELAQDAIFEGIHLIGGGSRLDGFPALLEAGIAVTLIELRPEALAAMDAVGEPGLGWTLGFFYAIATVGALLAMRRRG